MEFRIDEEDEDIDGRENNIEKFKKYLITLCPNLENPIQVNDNHSSKVIFESRLVMLISFYQKYFWNFFFPGNRNLYLMTH